LERALRVMIGDGAEGSNGVGFLFGVVVGERLVDEVDDQIGSLAHWVPSLSPAVRQGLLREVKQRKPQSSSAI
jgi:hypothetical protein